MPSERAAADGSPAADGAPPGPARGPAPLRLLSRTEFRLALAFWVASGTTAALRGTLAWWLPYAAGVVAFVALWPFLARTPRAAALLDWAPFPLVLATYDMLHAVSPRSWTWSVDPVLRAADRALLGDDAARLLEPLVHPAATTFLAACYVSYYVAPLAVGVLWWSQGRRTAFRQLIVGEIGLLFVGYVGYLLLPARGPHVYFDPASWTVPLDGDFASTWIRSRFAVHDGLAPCDAFPSLHTANAVTLLLLTRRHDRRAFLWALVPMLGLIVATVYLRFHYVVDVVAGAALALAWQPLADRAVARETTA